MRYVLTIVAVVLVATLSVALVVPLFIDWSAHRGEIEARLGAISGARVEVSGPIDLRLLPTPYLSLGKTSFTAPGPDAPTLTVESARFELALLKLASGAVRFSEAVVERPTLTIRRLPDGSLVAPAGPSSRRVRDIGFDRLVVHDGSLRVVGAGGADDLDVSAIDFDASAASLDGTIRAAGRFVSGGAVATGFDLLAGPAGETRSVKASFDIAGGAVAIELEGALGWQAPGGSPNRMRPQFSGSTSVSGLTASDGSEPPIPWRLSGSATIDSAGATIDPADVSLGVDQRAQQATGAIALAFGSPLSAKVELTAKQINLDALLRRKDEDGVPPTRALAAFASAFAPFRALPSAPLKASFRFSAPSGELGAQPLADLSLNAELAPDAPLKTRFAIGLPGRSRLQAEGDWDLGPAPQFAGKLDAAIGEFQPLSAWLSEAAPALADRLAALNQTFPYRAASLQSAIKISSVGFSARDVHLTLDRSTVDGSLAWTRAVGGDAARFYMDLHGDSLDVDGLPNFASGADLLGDDDLSLSLEAGSMHIAEVGEAEVASGPLTLKVSKTGKDVSLERLSIENLGGANVEAEGAINAAGRWLRGKLTADKLTDFAFLASRVAPGEISKILAERALSLSPTSLTFQARGGPADPTRAPFETLRVDGALGQTSLTFALDRATTGDGGVATIGLDAPEASVLFRQLGLPGGAGAIGRAHVSANARGDWGTGYDGDAAVSIAGSDVTWRGRILPTAFRSDDASIFGALSLKSANLSPLLAALAAAPVNGGPIGAADLVGDVTLRGNRVELTRLAGSLAGMKIAGRLGYRPKPADAPISNATVDLAQQAIGDAGAATAPQTPEIDGELALDRTSLGGLLALELGPVQTAKSGSLWSEAKFAPAPLSPPSAEILLRIGALDLSDALQGQAFSSTLRLGRGRLDLDAITMSLAGGTLQGRLTARRAGSVATLAGALAIDSASIARPGLIARVGGNVDFASTGASMAALVEGLAGSGQATLAGGSLARSDIGALDRVVDKSQSPDALLDETNIGHELATELDKARLTIPDGPLPIAISGGVARIGPTTIARPKGDATLSARVDLRTLALATRLTVTGTDKLKFWSGPPPTAVIDVDNAADNPVRRLDVGVLAAGLAAQSIARESDRIATLDADIRERAYFNRALKAWGYMKFMDDELEAWRQDQVAKKSLAERDHAKAAAVAAQAAVEKAEADAKAAIEAKAAAAKAVAKSDNLTIEDLIPSPAPDAAPSPPQNAPAVPPQKPKTTVPVDPTKSPLY